MTTYTVTPTNYNNSAFWSSISESASGHVLDFTGLPSSFMVSVQPTNNIIWIWDDVAWSSIGEAGAGTTFTLGAPTDLDFFTEVRVGDSTAELLGSFGNDTLISGSANDTVHGDAGNDVLESSAGNDAVFGGDDADRFDISDGFGSDTLTGGEGFTTGTDSDTLDFSAMTAGVNVTFSGDEAGTATDGTDTLSFSEIEALTLSAQADSVDAGDDSVGVDILAGAGNDTVLDGGGNDTIRGGDGADSIRLGEGDDSIDAGIGDDSIDANFGPLDFGSNTVGGGDGYDTLDLDGWWFSDVGLTGTITDAGYTITGGTSTVTGSGIEQFNLTYGGDTIDASAVTTGIRIFGRDGSYNGVNDDVLIGGSGNDTISSSDGHATITGGAGDDVITAINGNKLYLFADGFGNDTVDASWSGDTTSLDFTSVSTQSVTVSMTDGSNGFITSSTDSVLLSGGTGNFDVFTLGQIDDSFDATGVAHTFKVDGGLGNDTLIGGDGADTLAGGDGDDLIDGGAGDDFLTTGLGQDTLLGGTGNDTLMNAEGDDSLDGGAGDDSIVATGSEDTLRGGTGSDTMQGGDDDHHRRSSIATISISVKSTLSPAMAQQKV